jgi:hypothetical protein
VSALPPNLELFGNQLREATGRRARVLDRRRRIAALASAGLLLVLLSSVAVAAVWLGGRPAPASVTRPLAADARREASQARSLVGRPIASEAIVAASLDVGHFVWGAPTDTGGYCVGLSRPGEALGGYGCSGAAAGMLSSYLDCDGSVVVGGRIAGVARRQARVLTLRLAGRTLRVAIDPALHGFLIARLPGAFFRSVALHERASWPRMQLLDAAGHAVAPQNVTDGRFPPPNAANCG